MNRKIGIFATMALSLILMLAGIHEAQAKRMGGGKSFGSRPSYSAPYQRSTSPGATSQTPRSASQQQAAAQNQAARQNWAGRGGLMGMLGGLALGGLLGSLFFGGAFEHLNIMDMLLFAGIAYLLFRLFRAKQGQQPVAGNTYGRTSHSEQVAPTEYADSPESGAKSAGFNTDLLFGKNAPTSGIDQSTTASEMQLPANFDQKAFLAGAESAFRYLQSAWDNRDLAAIRGLTTDKVFAEIQSQLQASTTENKTEILKLTSELLEAREQDNELEAVVLFDSLMREDNGETQEIREVWHFTKPVNSNQPKWFLDGIQQLEL